MPDESTPLSPKQIHSADQLTGYMRAEAGNTFALFDEFIRLGFHRHEALDLVKLQVAERWRSIYSAKPTSPPK